MEEAQQLMADILFGKGWSSTLPSTLVIVLGEIAQSAPIVRADFDAMLREANPHTPQGLDSSVWEPLDLWTDESLATLDSDYGDLDEPRTADELNAEEAAQRLADQATFEQYLVSKGVPIEHTVSALLDLLIACEVVTMDHAGVLSLNESAPLPAEVLPLDSKEVEIQDKLRWERLHQEASQAIIRLFRTEGQGLDHVLVSLDQLAAQLETDPEDVRSAIGVLIDEGGFSTSTDIERTPSDQSFILNVDWEAFNQNRIHVSLDSPENQ
ncbi:DUF6042 family protein [Gulosibacter sp. 10]|uniref:DUF6042 family protein n=1 Tax=Gulosibacter sp. 10 TaxID=1255570 RepID=UPI000B35DF72|nr:DUF6042 family protein [Gulosibacter sp. 10]